ncbi:MAG: dihydrolipoyl dehydrogenase [Candidatus Erginobacter occultus]|nr:dihydrolipoyl dehydrogenase [Candidatus Erginobacter occultus]
MKEHAVDVAVVGAGTAGLYALSRARRNTDQVVVFDGGPLGTTCARVGCMPSKMLIHSSDNLAGARAGDVTGQNIRLDGGEIMNSLRRRRDRLAGEVIERIDSHFSDLLVRDYAAFREPMVLEAGGSIYRCRAIVLACGTSPVLPPGWRKEPGRIVTTDEFFELADIPENILVVGAGFIGVEIGQALGRMGKRVTMVEMTGSAAGISDPAVEECLISAISKSVDLRLRTKAILETAEPDGVAVSLEDANGNRASGRFDLAVVASGRKPKFGRLRLDRSGLDLDRQGSPEFDRETLRCRDRDVFLAGDCTGVRPFYHDAAAEGKLAGRNAAASNNLDRLPVKVPLAITFTRPAVCSVGIRFADLPEGAKAGEARFPDSPRGVADRIEDGIIRIYGDPKDGRILGSEMAAPAGEHLAHLLAALIQAGMTVREALDLPFYHPTYEETIQGALRDLSKKTDSS